MNYETLYNEALERAKECMKDGGISQNTIDYLCNIFPELAEAKDEKIRKGIIQTLKRYIKCVEEGHDAPSAKCFLIEDTEKQIAWLEKQESVGEIVERCKTSWYNEGKIAGMAEGLTDDEKYQQGWHDALEKQGKKGGKG